MFNILFICIFNLETLPSSTMNISVTYMSEKEVMAMTHMTTTIAKHH